MRADRDVIIIGAGLAGLMLAERLALSSQRQLRVEVLEQSASLTTARRSWSWYEAGRPRTAFDKIWTRWEMSAANLAAGRPFADGRYGLLRGEALAGRVMQAIETSPSARLRLSASVSAIRSVPGGAVVETSQGELSARMVIDTRPGGAELLDRARWVRTSIRAEVRTGSACFDQDTATLVHRLRREDGALTFETVLPLAADHAIIEAVRIARSGDERRPAFDRAVERVTGGAAVDIGTRMRSASPLGLSDRWPVSAPAVRIAASRGAGLALAGATGRDAQRGLVWAVQAFDALERGLTLPALPAQPLLARLSSYWLFGRLAARPSRLIAMAERSPGDPIVRLVGGTASLADAAPLLWASR
ncbi:lycopene cyclase family protein [Glycocaulis sp.]|uniref:lycopene cyclase family protein n=1 Tax=Glycocaulis sp. TaxID=1969725 RepID=UPI003D2024FD